MFDFFVYFRVCELLLLAVNCFVPISDCTLIELDPHCSKILVDVLLDLRVTVTHVVRNQQVVLGQRVKRILISSFIICCLNSSVLLESPAIRIDLYEFEREPRAKD